MGDVRQSDSEEAGDALDEEIAEPPEHTGGLDVGEGAEGVVGDGEPGEGGVKGGRHEAAIPDELDNLGNGLLGIGCRLVEELADPFPVRTAEGEKDGHRELALVDVRPGRLSELVGGGDEVEGVVGDLEDHPDLPSPRRDPFHGDGIGVGCHCPETGRRGDEARRLLPDDLLIGGDAVGEVEVEPQLAGLALDELGVRGGEEAHRLRGEMGRGRLRGLGHEEVSGEDGDGVRPVRVRRRGAAPGISLVDDVVVVETPDVDELDGDAGLDRAAVTGRSELGGEEGEKGPISLAAGREEVLGDVGETGLAGGGRLVEAPFDVCHAFPDAGERDQLVKLGHAQPMVPAAGGSPVDGYRRHPEEAPPGLAGTSGYTLRLRPVIA